MPLLKYASLKAQCNEQKASAYYVVYIFFGGINVTLNELSINETCRIKDLLSDGDARRRMLDMGFIPGTRLTAAVKAPFGEPTAYLVRGTLIALRKNDAEKIIIEKEPEKEGDSI